MQKPVQIFYGDIYRTLCALCFRKVLMDMSKLTGTVKPQFPVGKFNYMATLFKVLTIGHQ